LNEWSTSRFDHFTPEKKPELSIEQEAVSAPEEDWTFRKLTLSPLAKSICNFSVVFPVA